MAELFDYMSWNIEKFSKKHAAKEVFRNIAVVNWIARIILDMEASVLGVMEVTLGDGADACVLLKDAINDILNQQKPGSGSWKVLVSDRSVAESHKEKKKADKYAVFWDSKKVDIQGMEIADGWKVKFADRSPLYWKTVLGAIPVSCLLWHAPQPKNHQKEKTIKLLADLATTITANTNIQKMVISGDFNYNTGSTAVYKPLTDLKFAGLFDGERTTLTTLKSFLKDEQNRMKMVASGDYDEAFLASAYDNVFIRDLAGNYNAKVCVPYVVLEDIQNNVSFQIVTRLQVQEAMKKAKLISDHMPLVTTISEPTQVRPTGFTVWHEPASED
ncbi:hypothetical protein BK138_09360 [Paenibacillus rhizosphaerae]|uniref:Endonuclease/exonuclease/phosphatase domain-containing protein n=1 Tax=Paenibacillus rhizosphaerae TaxID=297318 RepID=A0A1R1F3T9_9BACL|nr:hypothetical protein [Paenibacillus rhizosphaerae]OMF58695.1 hypothetical protein BK138_09360 [Paenibacillus rhizosphaerae]